jgi:hypothetical protein
MEHSTAGMPVKYGSDAVLVDSMTNLLEDKMRECQWGKKPSI